MRRLFLAPLALVLLIGCGGDDDKQPAAQTGTTPAQTATAPATTTAPAPDPADDSQVAQAATLRLADLPPGWAADDDEGDDDDETSRIRCKEIQRAREAVSARKSSPDFEEGETKQVQNTVYLFPDEPGAKKAFDGIASRETRECMARELAAALRADLDDDNVEGAGEIETAQVAVDRVADDAMGSRLVVPMREKRSGLRFGLHVDTVFVRDGRSVSILTLMSALTPFDDALRSELTKTAGRRLAEAQG